MKHMQTGSFQHHPLMRRTLAYTCVFVAGLWVTDFAMYFSRMSLSPASVAAYYRGSEADFQPARSAASMLEATHAHLAMMALVLLVLTHLVIFAPYSEKAKRGLIALGFGSALVEEGSGWLVRFVHPAFAWLKVASFLAFQAALAFLVASLALFLWRASREESPFAHRRSPHRPEEV
jgi:hypothetical protein